MKRNTLLGLLVIVIASTFTACDISYFDNDIEKFSWKGQIKAPLGYAEYTLSELFEELEVSELEEDNDGNLSFSYTQSISGGNEAAFDVEIATIDFNSTISTPQSIIDVLDAIPATTYTIPAGSPLIQDLQQDSEPVVTDLNVGQGLTAASFDGGTLKLKITSTFGSDADLTLEIPSITKKSDNLIYSNTISIPANGYKEIEITLSDYNANFTFDADTDDYSSNVTNSFVTKVNAIFHFLEGDILTTTATITYDAKLEGAKTEVIYGDFLQEAFDVNNNIIDLAFFDDFGEGGMTFADASLTIKASNGFGFPIGIDVNGISGDTGIGTSSIDLTYTSTDTDEIAAGDNIIIFNGIETYSAGAASITKSITLDKDNSNINELLSSKPTRFNLNIAGKANPVPNVINENFYAAINDGLSVDVTVKVPLNVKFTDLKISPDDIEFDLGEDIDDLTKIELKVSTINNIPLSGTINLIFVQNGTILDLTKSIDVFEAAQIDALGNSNASTATSSILNFSTDELELLKDATHIQMDITFNSPEDKTVILNGNDTITLILNPTIGVEITIEE